MKKLNPILIAFLCATSSSFAGHYAVQVQITGSPDCPMYHVMVIDDNNTPEDKADDKVVAEGLISDCDYAEQLMNSELSNNPQDMTTEDLSVKVINTQPITITATKEESSTECKQFTIQISNSSEVVATGVLFEKKCGITGYGPTR